MVEVAQLTTWPIFCRNKGTLNRWAERGFRLLGGHPTLTFCLLLFRVRHLGNRGYRFRAALWVLGGGTVLGILEPFYRGQMGAWLEERVKDLRTRCENGQVPWDSKLPVDYRSELRAWNAIAHAACVSRPFPKLADQDLALALPDFEYEEALTGLREKGMNDQEAARKMTRAIERWLPPADWKPMWDKPARNFRFYVSLALIAVAMVATLFFWRPST